MQASLGMDNTDDDIYILSSHDTVDGSVGDPSTRLLAQDFVISRSPGSRADPAVVALQQAYGDLKKRYNETIQRNQQMSRALRDVGRVRSGDSDMATYGDQTDSFNAQGAAATGEQVAGDDNQRAQQGYIRFLEREKVNNEARLQQMSSLKASFEENCKAMQNKLKDTVTELQRKEEDLHRAHETIRELKEENMHLKDDRDSFRKHATDMQERIASTFMQSSSEKQIQELEELKVKHQALERDYNELKKECDRLKVSEDLAKSDLQTTNKDFLELQHSHMTLQTKCHQLEEELQTWRDADMPSGSSVPTAQELAHLKKVISDLRKTVLQQRDFLSKLGKSGKLPYAEGHGSGSSWENIGNPPPVSTSSVTYVKDGVELAPHRNSPATVLPATSWNTSPRQPSSGSVLTQQTQEHSRSEVLRRRAAENVPVSPRSKSEVLATRSNDLQTANRREPSPLGDLTWHQQTLSNVSHMNGGTAQFQSAYENANSRLRTPQAVIGDDFRTVMDNTPAFPVPSNLRQDVDLRASPEGHRTTGNVPVSEDPSGSEKICPVCSRDFSAMPMEDFQSHVFECFDDHSAPETLRAPAQNERICPMCNALFPEAIPQEEFEKHVQNHFEQDIIDRFEVLNP